MTVNQSTTSWEGFHETPWLSRAEKGLVVSAILVFAMVTVAGNLLTILAFRRDKKLRSNISNWYLVNLACADILVGSVTLSLDAVTFAQEPPMWLFGEIICKVYLVIDFVSTWQSIVAIILISLDRYRLVTRELKYKMYHTRKHAVVLCASSWVIISMVTILLVFGFPYLVDRQVFYQHSCDAEFLFHSSSAIVYTILTCFIPLPILIYLNLSVYINVRRRAMRRSGPLGCVAKQRAGFVNDEKARGGQTPSKTEEGLASTPTHIRQVTVPTTSRSGSVASIDHLSTKRNDKRHYKAAKTLAILIHLNFKC
ncbi:muscarinic acetylcholine receptor M3-like [Saccoglossus kowalevskii]